VSNTAEASAERAFLTEPDRLCESCLEAERTAPDGLCDDCAAVAEEAKWFCRYPRDEREAAEDAHDIQLQNEARGN
jgi:hypothetical protein